MRRKTPLRSRTPLQRSRLRRKTPLRSRPRNPSKYRSRERDTEYMLWVRRQPCAARALDPNCDGHVQADHAGRRSIGRKADDRSCIPLCQKHHTQRASFHGVFRSWSQATMRAWLQMTAAETRNAWLVAMYPRQRGA